MLSIIISLISGVLLSLAFPRADVHWLAWFALAPLMYYTYDLTWKRSLVCGFAFGMGFFGSLLCWIAIFGKFPWVVLAVFQSLFIVGFAALARLVGGRVGPWGRFAALPALWVALEWLRSLGAMGFTWGDIGYSQCRVLPLIQIASVTGVWGVSFVLALSNSALANLAAAHRDGSGLGAARAQVIAVCLVVLGVVSFGLVSMRAQVAGTGLEVRAAVLQGDLNPDADEDAEYQERIWRMYRRMTLASAEEGAELIVWPESVVPGCLGDDPYIEAMLTRLAADAGADLLVGALTDEHGKVYNSAFLIDPDSGILGRYSKVHLVPFGEYVVGRRYMPFLRYYRVTPYDLSSGPGYNLLDTGEYKVGTAICFESIFPDISRRLTASGAELLCIITNDSWFGRTAAAEQHMSKSVFRAVENRRYLVRGAATGISCIIDPHGRVLARAELFRPAAVTADVWTRSEKTFFTRHGNWFVCVCLVFAVLAAVAAGVRARASSAGREA